MIEQKLNMALFFIIVTEKFWGFNLEEINYKEDYCAQKM